MSEMQQYATPIKRMKQDIFIEEFAKHGNITLACRMAHVQRSTVYRWKEKSDKFLFRYNQALEEAKDNIRAEIYRRGHDGVEEPLISQGQIAYEYEPVLDEEGNQKYDSRGKPMYRRGRMITVRKFSDTLLIFQAKMLMPEYRDKSQVDVNQTGATQDMRALQHTLMQALSAYPEAKVAVAEALMQK